MELDDFKAAWQVLDARLAKQGALQFELLREQKLQQARRNLRNVELLGRTEHFARDVSRFPALLAAYGIGFEAGDTTPRNVTASDFDKTIEERLREVEQTLSPDTLAAVTGLANGGF